MRDTLRIHMPFTNACAKKHAGHPPFKACPLIAYKPTMSCRLGTLMTGDTLLDNNNADVALRDDILDRSAWW